MERIEENKVEQIAAYLRRYHPVYVYGAGKRGEKVIRLLRRMEIQPAAVVVSDRKGNPDSLLGTPVTALDEVSGDGAVFVIGVSARYEDEVVENLVSRRYTHILKLEPRAEKWKKNRSFPKLEITAQIGCRIRCRHCPQGALHAAYFAEDPKRCGRMSFEDYRSCVGHLPGDAIITFSGFVEPFLHPQSVEMMLYAHEQGHPIELYTTLSGLTERQFCRIKDIPFLEVVLHTPDKRHFADIPMTGEYKRVLDMALDCRKPNGEEFIDSANCQSEPSDEFLRLARGRVTVESSLVDRAGYLEGSGLRKSGEKKGAIVCNRSFEQNHWVLLPDGTVVLCCMDFGMKHVLGNLLAQDYREIMDGPAYQAVREAMLEPDGRTELLCRRCTSSGFKDAVRKDAG